MDGSHGNLLLQSLFHAPAAHPESALVALAVLTLCLLYAWACASLELAESLEQARPLMAEIEARERELDELHDERRAAQEHVAALRLELAQANAEAEALSRELGSDDEAALAR